MIRAGVRAVWLVAFAVAIAASFAPAALAHMVLAAPSNGRGGAVSAQLMLPEGRIEPQMVRMPNGRFALGKYVVTFAEWDACIAAGGCNGYTPDDQGWGRGRRPVINVSRRDALAYVQWLALRTGKAYRLPTKSEWEYAARGGMTTRYWWGNEIGHNIANCDGCGSQWDNKMTAPVGSFRQNVFGLFDMLGNVWQWCNDCYDETCVSHVLRGGSWSSYPLDLRLANQVNYPTESRNSSVGFRVALTIVP
ncbi:MAG: SUMF1/EgtB/PvdO family nonheme iron enzyme [Rhodospirillaceae bacterium]